MAKHRTPRRHHVARAARAVRSAPTAVRHPAVAAPLGVLLATGVMVAAASVALSADPAPVQTDAAPATSSAAGGDLPELPAQAPEQVEPAATTLGSYADYVQAAADIPDDALVAYQRAASVMATATPRCHLEWSVLAAIGRVASDHGGTDVAAAAHVDARRGAAPDTDGGALDGDATHDLPIGPLRLLPATWTVVAVDGDDDGTRDADDVDDAALAAGVVLCGADRDLDRDRDFREALRMFNTAPRYPDVIARLAAAYERQLDTVDEPDTLLAMAPPAGYASTTTATEHSQGPDGAGDTDGTPDATDVDTDAPLTEHPGNGDGEGGGDVTAIPTDTDKPVEPTKPTKSPTPTTPTATDCATAGAEATDDEAAAPLTPSASLTLCPSSTTSPTASSTPSTAGPGA